MSNPITPSSASGSSLENLAYHQNNNSVSLNELSNLDQSDELK